jgi:hypothetical protein
MIRSIEEIIESNLEQTSSYAAEWILMVTIDPNAVDCGQGTWTWSGCVGNMSGEEPTQIGIRVQRSETDVESPPLTPINGRASRAVVSVTRWSVQGGPTTLDSGCAAALGPGSAFSGSPSGGWWDEKGKEWIGTWQVPRGYGRRVIRWDGRLHGMGWTWWMGSWGQSA